MGINFITASVEAILFAGGEPVPASRISEVLSISENSLEKIIKDLNDNYSNTSSSLEIIKLDDCYQLCTKKDFSEPIKKAFEIKHNSPLSQAALEVLSVIAYNQPVTKSYVEQVRGVDCSGVVSSLCAKGLIEEQGRLDLPGRPLLYKTTPNFLRSFGLSSLEDLPEIQEITGKTDEESVEALTEDLEINEQITETN